MTPTAEHVRTFMKVSGACSESKIWLGNQGLGRPGDELWGALWKPHWRVFVMEKLAMPPFVARLYLVNVLRRFTAHVNDEGLRSLSWSRGFTRDEFLGLVERLAEPDLPPALVSELVARVVRESSFFGSNSFHYWTVQSARRLVLSLNEGDDSPTKRGWITLAAEALYHAMQSDQSPVHHDYALFTQDMPWTELEPYVTAHMTLGPTSVFYTST